METPKNYEWVMGTFPEGDSLTYIYPDKSWMANIQPLNWRTLKLLELKEYLLDLRLLKFEQFLDKQMILMGFGDYRLPIPIIEPIIKIRDEVHTRCKFASKMYFYHVNKFIGSNIQIVDNKPSNTFKKLSGIDIPNLPVKLAQALRIYNYYRDEYNSKI